MTENETIKALNLEGGINITGNPRRCAEFFEGLDKAIKSLEEIQQYRAIGSVEECRAAVDKQKAIKPEFLYMINERKMRYKCKCGIRFIADVDSRLNYSYCPDCGVKFDWTEEGDE